MRTLYDLLDALPEDDAESLRAAFRKAAKANYPDNNPGDPDAPLRFRRIVRANAILSDERQRAHYDRLLAVARRQRLHHNLSQVTECRSWPKPEWSRHVRNGDAQSFAQRPRSTANTDSLALPEKRIAVKLQASRRTTNYDPSGVVPSIACTRRGTTPVLPALNGAVHAVT